MLPMNMGRLGANVGTNMAEAEYLIDRLLVARSRTRGEIEFRLLVGVPRAGAGDLRWACSVSIEPLERGTRDIWGADAQQALDLALKHVRLALREYGERGFPIYFQNGQLFDVDTDAIL